MRLWHLRGRIPKLNARQQRHLTDLLDSGEHSISDLADLFGVSRATIYRTATRVHNGPARAATPAELTVDAALTPAPTVPADEATPVLYRSRHGG